MIELILPGQRIIEIEHLVCDVNGTLAVDGKLVEGVLPALAELRDRLQIHLITADTHGQQALIDQQLGLKAVRIQRGQEAEQKAAYVQSLDAEKVLAIGQGANDALMLKAAAIGICILSPEGLAVPALLNADLMAPDILTALEMIKKPLRLIASLRT